VVIGTVVEDKRLALFPEKDRAILSLCYAKSVHKQVTG
jgi:hypothetical protein